MNIKYTLLLNSYCLGGETTSKLNLKGYVFSREIKTINKILWLKMRVYVLGEKKRTTWKSKEILSMKEMKKKDDKKSIMNKMNVSLFPADAKGTNHLSWRIKISLGHLKICYGEVTVNQRIFSGLNFC